MLIKEKSISDFKTALVNFLKQELDNIREDETFTLREIGFLYKVKTNHLSRINNLRVNEISLHTLLDITECFNFYYSLTIEGRKDSINVTCTLTKEPSPWNTINTLE